MRRRSSCGVLQPAQHASFSFQWGTTCQASTSMLFLEECQALCCQNAWCISFDYAEKGDDATHGPRTCWLSRAGEGLNGGGGLAWDSTNNYHYYQITKRGSRFMTLAQPDGIASLQLASTTELLLSQGVDVWKLSSSRCPDRQMGDGTECKLCPLGRAGTGGLYPICRPGTFASEEGLSECQPCPPGTEMPGIGSTLCSSCAAGRYSAQNGTARCTACSPGYYNDRTGSSAAAECRACGTSQFSTSAGATACMSCPAGTAHDSYAVAYPSTCSDCSLCGTESVDGCPVPKDASCRNCPEGRVKTASTSCEYCALGQMPSAIPQRDECIAFPQGSFNAVTDANNRVCWQRQQYGRLACPQIPNSGWGSLAPGQDTNTRKYLPLTASENDICSSLHCMGAIFETQAIYSRQTAETCLEDAGMRELCLWSKDILNRQIDTRKQSMRKVEQATLLGQRQDKCRAVCDCAELCADVTKEEENAEPSFTVLPFTVTACQVHGLTCRATCASTRPAKTVDRPWECMSHAEVAQIEVQTSTLPRCDTTCDSCPDHSWHDASFGLCDGTSAAAEQTPMFLLGTLLISMFSMA
ncbi:unnamed protein product [Effrenium voratum]|nr:unnamed protein product [Effrenium voratum]